jgi:hypothetical protein
MQIHCHSIASDLYVVVDPSEIVHEVLLDDRRDIPVCESCKGFDLVDDLLLRHALSNFHLELAFAYLCLYQE